MASYLITGSSRGLGLELVKQLAALPTTSVKTIIATARNPSIPPNLTNLINSDTRIVYFPLDITSSSSISTAVSQKTHHLGPPKVSTS